MLPQPRGPGVLAVGAGDAPCYASASRTVTSCCSDTVTVMRWHGDMVVQWIERVAQEEGACDHRGSMGTARGGRGGGGTSVPAQTRCRDSLTTAQMSQRRWHPDSIGDTAWGLSQPGPSGSREASVAPGHGQHLPGRLPSPSLHRPGPRVFLRVSLCPQACPRARGSVGLGGRTSVCLSYAFLWTGTRWEAGEGALVLHIL